MSTTCERKIAILSRAFILLILQVYLNFSFFSFFSQLRKFIANLRDILVQVRNKKTANLVNMHYRYLRTGPRIINNYSSSPNRQ